MDNPQPPPYQQQSVHPFPAQPQQPSGPPVLLIILCILTLLGTIVTMGSTGYSVYQLFGLRYATMDGAGWMMFLPIPSLLFALGKCISAVLMLLRKKVGLILYTLFEVLAALLSIFISVIMLVYFGVLSGPGIPGLGNLGGGAGIGIVSTALHLLFSVVFIVLYWTQRRHLR